MNTSKKGKALIKKYEGCRLKAYKCPAGVLTIGYGHTNNVRTDDVITQAEADKLLDIDIAIKEKEVSSVLKVPVTQGQYDALVSFTFNLGIGNLKNSTLLRLLNQKNYKGAAQQFDRWVYAGNKVLAGLVKRRNEEKELFLS